MDLGAFSVSLAVKDLAASRAFYEKLGFAVFGGAPEQKYLIMKNGTTSIGLFEGMFEKNILTFNPGWDAGAEAVPTFTDVRELQRRLEEQGVAIVTPADATSTGPAHFVVEDPDGNPILVDQHVSSTEDLDALPTAFTVQLVTEADRDLLDRVDDDVFDHPVRPEYTSSFLANPAALLVVAIADGTVVGMASGFVHGHPDKPLQLFVNEVGVAERCRRRGVGSAMLDALRRGRELGCREAWVATEVDNMPARGLYRALGGVEDAERAVVYTYALSDDGALDPGNDGGP